jgi:para-aminobenzoate synthetase component 1
VSALAARGVRHVCALDAGACDGWASPPGRRRAARSILAAEPAAIFAGGRSAIEDALAWIGPRTPERPHRALLLACLSYDLGRVLSGFTPRASSAAFAASAHRTMYAPPAPSISTTLPHAWLAGFRAAYYYDPSRATGHVAGEDRAAVARLAALIARTKPESPAPLRLPPAHPRCPDASFRAGVRRIQDWIRKGDVYQVNLSRELLVWPVDRCTTHDIYARLCVEHPSAFAAYLDTGTAQIVSSSPERFLRVADREVETCPIKGTRPRGATPAEDRAHAADLMASSKDRAEHMMIVDLERNDLGRVCQIGTVRVLQLARLRRSRTVQHLISSVRGTLRHDVDLLELLEATFPGGSITGAPKRRAMQIIDELEPAPRGVYTGAIGYVDGSGDVDLSIAIRTATVAHGTLSLHVGGGIVAESSPDEELRETYHKARAFSDLWTA